MAATLCTTFARAANRIWDASGIATTTNTATDGSGTWDISTARWNNNITDQTWNNAAGDIAIIGNNNGAAGTLTLTTPITVGGLVFNAPGSGVYTLSGNTLSLTGSSTITANANATIASTLVGSTGMVKNGAGTLTLSGANSYTGGTAINGGTLQVASDANLGAATGALSLDGGTLAATASFTTGRGVTLNAGGGAFDVAAGTALTSTGVIAGGGGLTKTNAGTLVLNGANTYTGITTITGGVLSVPSLANGGVASGIGASTNAAGNLVLNGGTLQVSGTGSVSTDRLFTLGPAGGTISASTQVNWTNTGAIAFSGSGPRTLTLAGNGSSTLAASLGDSGGATALTVSGSWLLSGNNNTYSGLTTITTGATLQIGSGFNGSLGTGDVIDNGQLLFNSATIVTVPGVISGTGAVYQISIGTAILTGDNTYSGGTTINANGKLQLGNGGMTGSVVGDIKDNGTLTFKRSDNVTYGGVIFGGGSVNQAGSGTLVLSGANTYTGTTTVTAGVLSVSSLGNGGAVSSIGASTNAGTNLVLNGGVLLYTGAAADTDRLFTLGVSGGTLDASGTGALNWTNTGAITIAFGGVRTLTLTGSNTGANTLAASLGNYGVNATALTKSGAGTWVLTGANTYTGGTAINSGTLQVASDANLGAATGALSFNGGTLATTATFTSGRATTLNAGGGTIDVASGTILTQTGVMAGSGALAKADTGTLVLTGTNTYTGGTTISNGTLQLGNGGTTGSLVGNITDNGALAFNRSNALTVAGTITGSGTLSQIGSGITTLSGNSGAFSGSTSVTHGALWVNGTLGNAASTLTVSGGGTLGGTGTLGGSVSIADGILAPGNSPGTLTINGNLALAPASVLDYELGQANVPGGPLNDLTVVGGNLTLAGTLNISTSAGGTYGTGLYRMISYGGTLTNEGLALGTQPAGSTNIVQTSVAGQVNLINTTGLVLDFWDGGGAPRNNGLVDGGNGVWQAAAGNDNWTDVSGAVNAPYAAGTLAIFAAAPGAVTVDNSLGAVVSGGMQFATSGYVVQGGPITLATGSNLLRVGDGTASGAGYVATVASALTGAGGIDKTDLGTLVLTGANSYTGGTAIDGGTLQVASDANLGAATGALSLDGGTLAATASFTTGRGVTLNAGGGAFDVAAGTTLTSTGVIAGGGGLTKTNAGTLVLNGANTYTGITTITGGVLSVPSLANGGVASGIGASTNAAGNLVLNGGTLQVSGTGSVSTDRLFTLGPAGGTIDTSTVLNWTNTGAIAFSGSGPRSLTLTGSAPGTNTLAASLSDSGDATALIVSGTTTWSLTGANTYTGGTTIAAGTLQLGNGGSTGSLVGEVIDNGTLAFDHADTLTFEGVISGVGAVDQRGSGTTVLTAASTYTGRTTVAAGTLAAGAAHVFSPASRFVVQPAGTLDLRGADQTVAGLTNAGLVRTAGDPGTRLTTTNYTGQGGTLAIDTYLGADGSPSDRLVIDGGTASGTTTLAVTNAGGPGIVTTGNGIPVIEALHGGTT
ncbi:beta strand repeat-containing protein, partial [Dyella japonica]